MVSSGLAMLAGLILSNAAAAATGPNPAAEPSLQVVKLKNGFNLVTLFGIDYNTFVAIAHRESHNAHSYDMTTFYADLQPREKSAVHGLQVIPLEDKSGVETQSLFTHGGTDCTLNDYRLVNNRETHEAWLIVARREPGKSVTDHTPVTFVFYKLVYNTAQVPGVPTVQFKFWKTQQAKHDYCDVEKAFEKELDLGLYRTDLTDRQ
jgi:hypothetical protein